ncbi:hypothetical protein O181_090551 [Austropuccinia psidii MF-1]|uniref:Integrase catalytic domain-containing protein n=1 Tax=Austropuccinia psidii MF-1 TaxID=1389203 RepID=A0A9Q3P8T5_9BASI|nr:hypothetical protein [Austropuccinia psidii MF-1]
MYWVTDVHPGGDRSFNSFLGLANRYRKPPMFLPCHEDYTAMDKATMIWNRAISHTVLLQIIISDRDPKFTSALWKNLHNLFVTKLSFSKAYYFLNDGLAERVRKNIEEMMRKFCAYGRELKEYDGFTHDLCTFIPALDLENMRSINSSTSNKPAI